MQGYTSSKKRSGFSGWIRHCCRSMTFSLCTNYNKEVKQDHKCDTRASVIFAVVWTCLKFKLWWYIPWDYINLDCFSVVAHPLNISVCIRSLWAILEFSIIFALMRRSFVIYQVFNSLNLVILSTNSWFFRKCTISQYDKYTVTEDLFISHAPCSN